MIDVDYNGDFWKVFYGVNDHDARYFNIHDTGIDIHNILEDDTNKMKFLDSYSWIELNFLLYHLFEKYINKFSEDYLNKILTEDLYI